MSPVLTASSCVLVDVRHRRRGGKGRKGKGKGGGGGEQEVTVFVCAVCKKDFKSKGQMANHETSKAHKKKLKVCIDGGGYVP